MPNSSNRKFAPATVIREPTRADLESVLAINEAAVPAMNGLSRERVEWFALEAAFFRVAECDQSVAGFVIGLASGADYDSANLHWLNERYRDFLYIDRVAVAPEFRRRGVASALYRAAAASATGHFRAMACEVNLRPRNEESLQFHSGMGFDAVGTQDHGEVEVQYMVRPIPL